MKPSDLIWTSILVRFAFQIPILSFVFRTIPVRLNEWCTLAFGILGK